MTASMKEDGREPPEVPRAVVWGAAAALMLLPVLAIRGFDPAAWDPPGDFIFLAILFGGVAVAWELAARVSPGSAYKVAIGMAVAAGFLSAWINLAVGIIGSEDNPANLIYAAVIAVAAAGASLARFHPPGMARAMLAAAVAQGLAFIAALAAGLGFTGPITVFFTALWLISAWLFLKAATAPARAGGPGTTDAR